MGAALRPARADRSRGGFRLHSEEDERRVRARRALIEEGLSAAEATMARAEALTAGGPSLEPGIATARLIDAVGLIDEGASNAVLDERWPR